MKASEAHEKTVRVNTSNSNSQYSRVIQKIEQAANGGHYKCWFYEAILDDVRIKLTNDGYTVGTNRSDRDGSQVEIAW